MLGLVLFCIITNAASDALTPQIHAASEPGGADLCMKG